MKQIRFLLLALAIGSCKAQTAPGLKTNKDDNTLLWEVSGNGLEKNTYLFGTFHLLCRADMHLGDQLKQGIKNADVVYLELDMDDPAMLFGSLGMMTMKNGKKLKDLYTEADYRKVESYFNDTLQTPIMLLQTMKPLLLEAMLYPKMLPCKTTSGVEEEVMKLAKENKKEIKGLETFAFQAAVFDSIPYEEQAKQLLQAIDSPGKYRENFANMINVYKKQELKGIEQFMNEEDFDDKDKAILLDNRNKNWVNQLRTIMKKESVFVAVGAGHLVGENGLIALLRREGYTVKPIEN